MRFLSNLIIFLLVCSPVWGATQLKKTVCPSGCDYTSLEACMNANEFNLTDGSVKIFSGSYTGTLTAGDSVTLYRGGSSQSVTGTVNQVKTTTLFVTAISNTGFTFQANDEWRKDGSNLFTMSNAGDTVYFDVEISGDWSSSGVNYTEFTIHNYTTDATHYINVYATGTARNTGVWRSSAYTQGFDTWGNQAGSEIYNQYVTIDGIQLYQAKDYSGYGIIHIYDGGEYAVIKNTLSTCRNEPPNYDCGSAIQVDIGNGDASGVLLFNNINYGGTGFNTNGGLNVKIYNNTSSNGAAGWDGPMCYDYNCSVTLKNNIFYNNTKDYSPSSGYEGVINSSSTNNLSKDATAPALNTYYRNKTLTFVNTTSGSEDFHLVAGDTDAIDKGADLSGTFTTDIDGTTRIGTWDIGADEYVSTAVSLPSVLNDIYVTPGTDTITFN